MSQGRRWSPSWRTWRGEPRPESYAIAPLLEASPDVDVDVTGVEALGQLGDATVRGDVEAVPVTVVSEYSESNYQTHGTLSPQVGFGYRDFGQTFVHPGGKVVGARVYLKRVAGQTDGNIFVRLWATSGNLPTSLIATSVALDTTTIGTGDFALYDLTFSSAVALTPGTTYALTLYTGTSDQAVQGGLDSSSPTHAGQFVYWDNDLASWGGTTATDFIHYLYVEPGLLATAAVGSVAVATAVEAAASGVEAVGEVGSVTVDIAAGDVAVDATGVEATGQVGDATVRGDVDVLLSGVEATGQIGTAEALPDTLAVVTGVEVAGQVGTVEVYHDQAISVAGVEAAGQVGDVTILAGMTIEVTGVEAVGQVGDAEVSTAAVVALSGVEATGQVGNAAIIGDADVPVSGVEAAAATGTVTVRLDAETAVSGVEALGLLGDVTVAMTGNQIVLVSGVEATGQVGDATVRERDVETETGIGSDGAAFLRRSAVRTRASWRRARVRRAVAKAGVPGVGVALARAPAHAPCASVVGRRALHLGALAVGVASARLAVGGGLALVQLPAVRLETAVTLQDPDLEDFVELVELL